MSPGAKSSDPGPSTPPDGRGLFITATGTGAGKTFVTRGLARLLLRRRVRVAAIKPLETGCTPEPLDALAIARACENLELARDPAFYRAAPPLAPYAATLSHAAPEPDLDAILARIAAIRAAHDFTLVEGAGGLLVPLDARRTNADLAAQLALPLLLVAPDRLGVLSHVLAAHEAAIRRNLAVASVILCAVDPPEAQDPSTATNTRILAERLPTPVHRLPFTSDDDDALAAALASTPIPDLLHT